MIRWLAKLFGWRRVYRCEWGEYLRRYDSLDFQAGRPIHRNMSVAPPWAKGAWARIASALLAALLSLGGCTSPKEQIANAAAVVQVESGKVETNITGAQAHLVQAKATGDVGPKAEPFIDSAHSRLDAAQESNTTIRKAATSVQEALPGVKDVDGWLTRLIKSLGFWIFVIAAVVLSLFYAPVLRPLLLHIGAWINFIPKPVKVDAEADAEVIAANETGKAKATVKQVAAIERKKATDPRYRKALDKALNAEGVPT